MFFHDSGVSQIRSPHGHLRHYLLRHTDHRSDTITNQPKASIVTDSAICKASNVTQCHSSHQRGFKCHTFQLSERLQMSHISVIRGFKCHKSHSSVRPAERLQILPFWMIDVSRLQMSQPTRGFKCHTFWHILDIHFFDLSLSSWSFVTRILSQENNPPS